MQVRAFERYISLAQVKRITAVRLTCINLPHGFQNFALSVFEWPLKTGFTVLSS